jgi:hypothetical protein
MLTKNELIKSLQSLPDKFQAEELLKELFF